MLRISEPGGVTHEGDWTWGTQVGRTACQLEFITRKTRGQRKTTREVLLRRQEERFDERRKGQVLEDSIPVDCMTCLIKTARAP